ncbi:hypothetical protein FisN_4Lh439 [Fistulifera solaris]|uniref:DRTGG domain-containing protein n=1 Tax=Fistulifera solaris TaxID=1519565 RepID=A0A1Z5KDH6_FISSO|nr:hypothetical protein FisN_4Lh439 [Fistulifera solaris]|eukprot:GAX24323.1 hypothetical protein FisN_4Lh439 [Fistulifera solaris]
MNETLTRFFGFDPHDISRIAWFDDYSEDDFRTAVGLVLNYSSWNRDIVHASDEIRDDYLQSIGERVLDGLSCRKFVVSRQIDECDDTMEHFICDNDYFESGRNKQQIPPESLPVFSLVVAKNDVLLTTSYITTVSSRSILNSLATFSDGTNELDQKLSVINDICSLIGTQVDQIAQEYDVEVDLSQSSETVRIFIAGDRSSVGKSSVCLGLLGNLLQQGYKPEELAYIKPATQSESTQLVQLYCDKHGIACVPIGPLVYYRGFTRAFLAGETQSTEELLDMCGRSVDRIAVGKRVVLVDGVGFPAVGSICGTDNASVLKACSYPVLNENNDIISRKPMAVVLVGGGGVGGAVDAFNLNATYFSSAGVTVIGGIFNKLAIDGFYSLENCKSQVTRYFDSNEEQLRQGRRPFGFVPVFPPLSLPDAMQHVDEYIKLFGVHVDIHSLLLSARQVRDDAKASDIPKLQILKMQRPAKSRSRADIETSAVNAGAAPSA